MRGVVRCVVGYTGGNKLHPTYKKIVDHTEALLIEFDPKLVSYEDLLISWSRMHTPVYERKCQYRSAVWYLNDEQKEVAEEVLEGIKAARRGDKVYSTVEKATRFYRAEEYHQDFLNKSAGY